MALGEEQTTDVFYLWRFLKKYEQRKTKNRNQHQDD